MRTEKTIDGDEDEEKSDGEDGGPGKPIPRGTINHGYGRIGGVVQNDNRDVCAASNGRSEPILELDEALAGTKFHDGHIASRRKRIRRTAEILLLITDDYSLRSHAFAD